MLYRDQLWAIRHRLWNRPQEYAVLAVVAELADGGIFSPPEALVASELGLEMSAIRETLMELEKEGYVELQGREYASMSEGYLIGLGDALFEVESRGRPAASTGQGNENVKKEKLWICRMKSNF